MKLVLLFLCFTSHLAFSYEKKFALKGGPTLGFSYLQSRFGKNEVSPRLGVATYFTYKWQDWELGLSSHAHIGLWNEQGFFVHESQVEGKGYYHNLAFGPVIRKYFQSENIWRPYLTAVPLFGLRTYKFLDTEIRGGVFQEGQKITYESFGILLAYGREQNLAKLEYPKFWEISYQVLTSRRRTEVGGTVKAVKSIIHEHDHQSINEHSIVFSIGILLI